MTRTQQRITTQAVPFRDAPFQLKAHQKAALVKLDDQTRDRYGFTGGPVFLTHDAAESPGIGQALDWFNDAPSSIETGMTVQIGPGLECLFGFNPDAPNRDAFFVFIWKN
ncbi:hypothetical protein LGM54_30455 [Burkholderia cenocepacia]|uniref:hypothetical protein n=1 Tax=Burkholderia cenocepacia TaxID=95486 RepID=UPI001CF20300|nr:hypothetical protein [Burkholderia cenocepacia]MCA7967307.1 hypothetical protein [Burkholderia cenocepacia]